MRGWRTAAAILLGIAGATHGRAAELTASDRIVVRDVADGAGPSNLISFGAYLLVVDPWAAQIRRYVLANMRAAPAVCGYPRGFSPWRSERGRKGVRLIGEPYGPEPASGYRYRSRETMLLSAAAVAMMPVTGDCRFPIVRYQPFRDTPARIARPDGERPGAAALFPLRSGHHARLTPVGGPRAEIYAVRDAGSLSKGRLLLWWSEIDAFPRTSGPAGSGGRVTASQYVGVLGRRGGPPRLVVRLLTAAVPTLAPGGGVPVPALLTKPGFEIAAGATQAGRDALWIIAADMQTAGPRQFVLRRYDLTRRAGDSRPTIALAGRAAADRNDAAGATERPRETFATRAVVRGTWFARARVMLRDQIRFPWRFPAGAVARPCGGTDRCPVGANGAGALGTGPLFGNVVIDKLAPEGQAIWMRPRQLIGVTPGTQVRGIPYSIGGEDLADSFAGRLSAYVAGAPDPPPVGHIREGMEWVGQGGNYPLGIDCSALVAKVFALDLRSTSRMMRGADVSAGNRTWRLPSGPAHACPEPVRHISEIKPGDLFLRDGHVVIYAGTARIGASQNRSRGLRVFEASSRCGAVCESVYDPTFFAGWWIVRLQLDPEGRDCPRWLARTAE